MMRQVKNRAGNFMFFYLGSFGNYMRQYIYILTMFVLCGSLYAEEKIKQAIPFVNMLRAAEESDVEGFKYCYSKRIREDQVQSDWKANIIEATQKIRELFGNIRYEDFSFEFVKESSKLEVFYNGISMFKIKVIQENGTWKLDER